MVKADLQKAFLQIKIAEEDQRYLRFLLMGSDDLIRMYQMTATLPFGLVTSPTALTTVVQMIVTEMGEPYRTILDSSIYMDDLIVELIWMD